MRALIIATTVDDISAFPEMHDITNLFQATIKAGKNLTVRELYKLCERYQFDIIHYIGHTFSNKRENYQPLSQGEQLTAQDWRNLVSMCDASLIFFSSCDTAYLANTLIRDFSGAIVYTTIEINDRSAWKTPLLFYERLAEGPLTMRNIERAFYSTTPTDGTYALVMDGERLREEISHFKAELSRLLIDSDNHKELMDNRLKGVSTEIKSLEKRISRLEMVVFVFGAIQLMAMIALFVLLFKPA